MSYLPRMSKTYKEPEERNYEDTTKEITFNSIPIASALPNDKSYNPQTILKQYNFYPHPPPQLPGPSLVEEAEQIEKLNIEVKRRRTTQDSNLSQTIESVEEFPYETTKPVVNVALISFQAPKDEKEDETPANIVNIPNANKRIPREATVTLNKNKESKKVEESSNLMDYNTEIVRTEETAYKAKVKKHMQSVENENYDERDTLSGTEKATKEVSPSLSSEDLKTTAKLVSKNGDANPANPSQITESLNKISKSSINEGIQCTQYGWNEKEYIMPSSVHYLIKTLSFLVQELNENEDDKNITQGKEIKKLLGQIDESINSLLRCPSDSRYSLQTSISDSKRLEKIYNDLIQYINFVYGEKGKFGHKSEEKKKLYCSLYQKDCELKILQEKLRESEIQNPSIKFLDQNSKSPEVVLQNKNLENEQLMAEIEFNSQELKRFQQALAEKNWEIQKSKEEIVEIKKRMSTCKSKFKKFYV